MRATFGQYLTAVELEIDRLTNGEIHMSDLVDFADSDSSPGSCYSSDVPARECALLMLHENGADEMLDTDDLAMMNIIHGL